MSLFMEVSLIEDMFSDLGNDSCPVCMYIHII